MRIIVFVCILQAMALIYFVGRLWVCETRLPPVEKITAVQVAPSDDPEGLQMWINYLDQAGEPRTLPLRPSDLKAQEISMRIAFSSGAVQS